LRESVLGYDVQRDVKPVRIRLWREGEPKQNAWCFVLEEKSIGHHIEHMFIFRYRDLRSTQYASDLRRGYRYNGWLGSQCKHVVVYCSEVVGKHNVK
jgi:hypothetical protein